MVGQSRKRARKRLNRARRQRAKGDKMQNSRGLVTHVVSDADRQEWLERSGGIKFCEWGPFSDFVAAAKEVVPSNVAEAMQQLRDNKCWGIRFENLPNDLHTSEAPEDGCRPSGKESISEVVSVGIVACVADPFGYLQERSGRLVHEVAPSKDHETERSSVGKVGLGGHIDAAYLDYLFRPHLLLLYGQINDAKLPTLFYPLEDVLDGITYEEKEDLTRKEFRIRTPDSFAFRHALWVGGISILEDVNGVTMLRFNRAITEPETPRAERALTALCRSLDKLQPLKVVTMPATAVVFANNRVLHARGPIETGRRWLQRVFGTWDLAAIQKATGNGARIFNAPQLL
jgi:hypothetical protein